MQIVFLRVPYESVPELAGTMGPITKCHLRSSIGRNGVQASGKHRNGHEGTLQRQKEQTP
jgi:hypothetical protein